MVEGATSVTVLPSVTTVVGLSVVVTAAAEDCGVLTALDVAGSGAPAELGLEAVEGAGITALVVTAAFVGLVAAGAGAVDVGLALGAGVIVALWVIGGWVVMGACVVGAPAGVDAGTVRVGVSTTCGALVLTGGSLV
jgi:hypothetical protein